MRMRLSSMPPPPFILNYAPRSLRKRISNIEVYYLAITIVGVVHCYCKRLPYIFLILGKQKKRNEDLKKRNEDLKKRNEDLKKKIANLEGELNAYKDQPQQQGEFRIDLSIGLNCMNIFQIREIIFFQGLLDTTEPSETRVEQPTTELNAHRLIKIYELMDERENLRNKLKKIECETVKRLRREGQACERNCVSLAMLWICKHKLESIKFICCAPQFEKFVTMIAFHYEKLFERINLKCGYFMKILENLKLVKKVYEELDTKKAWEKLMKMKERVCILATWNAQNEGHVVVFDLETRTSTTTGGEVKFYNRQALLSNQEVTINLKKMIEYVNGSVGLRLYTVDLDELSRIMVYYEDVLHITEKTSDTAKR